VVVVAGCALITPAKRRSRTAVERPCPARRSDTTDACTAVTGDGIGLPTFADRLAYAAGPYNERVVCSRADLMGTRRFYGLLRGDAAPTLAEADALARACNVRPEWLAFGSGAMRTAPASTK